MPGEYGVITLAPFDFLAHLIWKVLTQLAELLEPSPVSPARGPTDCTERRDCLSERCLRQSTLTDVSVGDLAFAPSPSHFSCDSTSEPGRPLRRATPTLNCFHPWGSPGFSMAKLTLHVGCHRTGSTSIQAALLASRARLRRLGVLHPRTGLITQAHHAFGYAILAQRSPWGGLASFDDLQSTLAAEIAASRCHSVVMSSELFTDIVDAAAASAEVRDRLRRFLAMFAEVRILCVVRHQLPLLESAYRFEVLWKHTAEQRGFSDYVRQRMAEPHFAYPTIASHFRSIRPDVEVEFLGFAAASRAHEVVSHFFARAGIAAAYRGEVWINQSQSRLGTLAVLLHNQGRAPTTLGRPAFVNWTKRTFPNHPESLYDADLARHVAETFCESNDSLADITTLRLNDEPRPFMEKHRLAGPAFTPDELEAFTAALRRRHAWRLIKTLQEAMPVPW